MNSDDRSISCIILAGGVSSRLGEDKTLLRYKNRRLIDIVIECAAPLFSATYISGKVYTHPLVNGCFEDEITEAGPLGGIYTALRKSNSTLNFIVGADYPLLDPGIIRLLRDRALDLGSHCDGLIPQTSDGLHPLFAFYRKSCARYAELCISRGCYRVRCMEKYGSFIHYTPKRETAAWQKNFTNINSPLDYSLLRYGCTSEPSIPDKNTKKRS